MLAAIVVQDALHRIDISSLSSDDNRSDHGSPSSIIQKRPTPTKPSSVSKALSYRIVLLSVLISSMASFYTGRMVLESSLSNTFSMSNLLIQRTSIGNQTAASSLLQNRSSATIASLLLNQQLQQQRRHEQRLAANGWFSSFSSSSTRKTHNPETVPSCPTPAVDHPHSRQQPNPSSPSLSHYHDEIVMGVNNDEDEDDPVKAARLRYFQELIVHPVLLSMKVDHEAERIAIVLDDGDEDSAEALLEGLVHQILQHSSVEHIYVVVEDSEQDCPDKMWMDLSQLLTASSSSPQITAATTNTIECVVLDHLPSDFQVDVVWMLDGCDVLDDDEAKEGEEEEDLGALFRLWSKYLSPASGSLVTCLGETLPFHHPMASLIHRERMTTIEALDDASFEKIIEYDIRLPGSRFAQSIVVAMKDDVSMAQWRMNEAMYSRLVQDRMEEPSVLEWFDSATMISLKYPSKHSAVRFCQPYGTYLDHEGLSDACPEEGHGYDPFTANIPIDDLYVGKSQAGDHAGRGVFTKVDIPTNAYVGLETTVHSIMYEWTTSDLHDDMNLFVSEHTHFEGHIINVYAEAYGYSQEPWNKPQESVMSHLLTFMNHGCNGTANIGDFAFADVTEFTIDLESGHIPDVFKTKVDEPYLPHFDRDQVKLETMSRAFRPIKAGEELYDNYLSFGGDTYFKEMVESLRQECSGSFGMVEQYQRSETIKAAPSTWTAKGGLDEL